MRIRTGSQVEVWTQETASPVGAWRGGEVQWGNGHSYILRWHDGSPDSGRVSRKLVRPRPPPAPVPLDLDAGDMVEVFDEEDCLWKCAEVVRAAADGDRQFRVKIVGAAKVLTVAPTRLRVRQVLRDDDVWVALHKDNQIAAAKAVPLRANGGGHKPAAPGFKPSKQKRSLGMFDAEPIANGKMFEDTATKRLCIKDQPRYEVEVIEVPNVCLNKQYEIGSEDCDVIGTGSNNTNNDGNHHQNDDSGDDYDDDSDSESESVSSSDGSSSSSSDSRTRSIDVGDDCAAAPAPAPAAGPCDGQKADEPPQHCQRDQRGDMAEARETVRREQYLNDDEKAAVREEIHRLELEAYTALTKAFHASGDALSWAKAELLTDLRVHLHISNDEHLQVINEVANRKGRRYGRPDKF